MPRQQAKNTSRLKPQFEQPVVNDPMQTVRPRKRLNAPPIVDEKQIARYLELHAQLVHAIVGTNEERQLDKATGRQWKALNKEEKKEVQRRLKRNDKDDAPHVVQTIVSESSVVKEKEDGSGSSD